MSWTLTQRSAIWREHASQCRCVHASSVRQRSRWPPNDLVCTLVGIDHVHPFVAAWFEGPSLLVGRADLTEYLAYQKTRQQVCPQTPDALLFSLVLSGEAPRVMGTKGLGFFEHPDLYAHGGSFDAVPVLYNAAAHVVSGATLEPGHTMSMSQGTFEVVTGTFEGHPALQLIAR